MDISSISLKNTNINTSQVSYKSNRLYNNDTQEDTVSITSKGNNAQPESFWNKLLAKLTDIRNKVLHGSGSKIQNGTYYNSVYKGFEEHFYTKTDTTVVPIELSQKQKQLLTEKINTFENYKNGLSEEQLQELEKNKHGLLDFSLDGGMPDLELKGYKKFLNRYESFKNGDFSGITNEELAQILYYTDISDIISDGKIGSFAQGRVGSCWFLSMLGNYAATPEGEQNIANRISKPDKDGNYTELEHKNVDTGLGFERVLTIMNGKESVYDTELFNDIICKIEEISGRKYDETTAKDFRIIADHLRASTFILGDDKVVTPSNVDQGYILRRLIRRASRELRKIGVEGNQMRNISKVIIDQYKEVYPELGRNEEFILTELSFI